MNEVCLPIVFDSAEGRKVGVCVKWINKLWLVDLVATGRSCFVMPGQIVWPKELCNVVWQG